MSACEKSTWDDFLLDSLHDDNVGESVRVFVFRALFFGTLVKSGSEAGNCSKGCDDELPFTNSFWSSGISFVSSSPEGKHNNYF